MEKQTPSLTATDRIITRVTSYLAILVILFLIYKGIRLVIDLNRYEETNDAQIQEYINPLVTRVSGYIREIRYEENDHVEKGDTLIIIDRDQYGAKKLESLEAVNNARSQMAVLESNIKTAQKLAEVAKVQIGAARARVVRAKKDFARYEKLVAEESATGQQLEAKREALDVSTAEYTAALGSYQASLSKVNDYRAQGAGIASEVRRRGALETQADLDLSYTVITSPYRGKMSRKSVQVGQFVQANQTLANIVNANAGKWVVANFKETQIAKIRNGQNVIIEADAYPGMIFHGKVESVSPGTGSSFTLLPPDNSTGNFVKVVQRIPIKIDFSNPNENNAMLSAGMNTVVKIIK